MNDSFVFVWGILRRKKADGASFIAYLNTVRGFRYVGDGRRYMKTDRLMVITNETDICKEMEKWRENDIVEVRGVLVAKKIEQKIECTNCGFLNTVQGSLTFIKPSFAKLRKKVENAEDAHRILKENREISNQIYMFGTLCRDPKKIKSRDGFPITQYQTEKGNWVKSYGDNALEDRERLKLGSTVFIDGCLQRRRTLRHCICGDCQKTFDWHDESMEIVPYETEYIYNIRSDEEIEENKMKFYNQKIKDLFPDEEITVEDMEDGFDCLFD